MIVLMLPWWLRGKYPPANAGDMGSVPDPGRFHMLQSNEARVPQLLTHVLQQLRLSLLEPVLCNKRSHHEEKPVHRN